MIIFKVNRETKNGIIIIDVMYSFNWLKVYNSYRWTWEIIFMTSCDTEIYYCSRRLSSLWYFIASTLSSGEYLSKKVPLNI
jgi:hypothetical protein